MNPSMRLRIVVLVLSFILAMPALAAARRAADTPPATPSRLLLPLVAAGGCGNLNDNFTTARGWFTGERDGLVAELRDGEYRLLVTRPGFVWLVGAPGCARFDDQAAVDARWAGQSGNFYGLLFAMDGRLDRAHVLAVGSDARVWVVFRVHDDGLETVLGPTHHDAIRPGGQTNRLSVARAGGRVVLSINGAAVGELADPLPGTPAAAGLVAASLVGHAPADARFDNFVHEGVGGGEGRVAGGGSAVDQWVSGSVGQ